MEHNKLPLGLLRNNKNQEKQSPVFRVMDEKLKCTMRISVTKTTHEALDQLAQRHPGLTVSDVARQAIEFALLHMEEK